MTEWLSDEEIDEWAVCFSHAPIILAHQLKEANRLREGLKSLERSVMAEPYDMTALEISERIRELLEGK